MRTSSRCACKGDGARAPLVHQLNIFAKDSNMACISTFLPYPIFVVVFRAFNGIVNIPLNRAEWDKIVLFHLEKS